MAKKQAEERKTSRGGSKNEPKGRTPRQTTQSRSKKAPAAPSKARRRRKESPLERKEWGYDPLLGLESIKTTMSGLLADLFAKRSSGSDLPSEPPIDLYEEGNNLVIEMTLPGATKQDIQMHAYHNLLIIRGETRPSNDVAAERYHFHERRWGPFHRSIPLPYMISPEEIKANLCDGILRVTLPVEGKMPPSKSVQVKIE